MVCDRDGDDCRGDLCCVFSDREDFLTAKTGITKGTQKELQKAQIALSSRAFCDSFFVSFVVHLTTILFTLNAFPVARCKSAIALFKSVCAFNSSPRAVVNAVCLSSTRNVVD